MGIRGSSLVTKFGLTLFIAKFLGFEALGFYGLITAACIMSPSILGLAFMQSLARKAVTHHIDLVAEGLRCYSQYIALLYLALLIVTLGIISFTHAPLLISLIFLIIFFEHINQDLYALQLNLSMSMSANVLHFIRSGGWMIFFMLGALFNPTFRNIESLLIAWLCGSILAFIGFVWINRVWLKSITHTPKQTFFSWIKQEFGLSRILYFNHLVITGSQYADRYLVTYFLGLEITGIYVFYLQICSALSNLVNTGVVQIAKPKMVKAYADKDPDYQTIFNRGLKNTFFTAVILALTGGLFIYFLLPYIGRSLAYDWFPSFGIMLIGFIISSVADIQSLVFYSQHQDKLTLIVSSALLVFALGLNLLLIPIFGLWGAVIAFSSVPMIRIIIQTLLGKYANSTYSK